MRLRFDVKTVFRRLLLVEDKPDRIARGFALGVFIAFTPFIGLHTITALVAAVALRLSKVVVLAGIMVNNPWTMIFIYGIGYQTGLIVLGERGSIASLRREDLVSQHLWAITQIDLPAFVVGTMLLGAVAAVLSYFVMFFAITIYRKRLVQN